MFGAAIENSNFGSFAGGSFKLKVKSAKKVSPLRVGIIDLGTNSVRFDIYLISGRKVTRIYRDKKMIRLGDGVYKTGRLSQDGIKRAERAFRFFRQVMKDKKVTKVVAFGTSALRSSKNAKVLLAKIKKDTGINVRVISGQEEGRIIAKGILSNIEAPATNFALIDIGGGSTEVSICRNKSVIYCKSLSLGANRLQQLFLKTSPPQKSLRKLHPVLALRQKVREELAPVVKKAAGLNLSVSIGSSGTIRALLKILKRIGNFDDSIARYDLAALVAEMSVMSRAQLLSIPNLEPKRVDLILAGSIILEELMYALNIRRLFVTEFALRDGILEEVLERF